MLKKAFNRLKRRQKVCSLPTRIVQLDPSKNLGTENILRAPKPSGLHQIVVNVFLQQH